MEIETIEETKHKELSKLLSPLIEFMNENNFSYFFVAGKYGLCSRYMAGDFDDLSGMLTGMMETNKQVKGLLEYSLESLPVKKNPGEVIELESEMEETK